MARAKICGLRRRLDAVAAVEAGADYIGLVLSTGFGRSVSPESAADIVRGLDAVRVAVVVDESPEQCARLGAVIGAGVLQLHGSESPQDVRTLRDLGEWTVWKAVRARSGADVESAVSRYGDLVDGFLVEGYRDGAVGGAGLLLDVDPDEIRRALTGEQIFILAGGLTPETVGEASARFGPDVVDVSGGVEQEPGVKDAGRMEVFIRRAHASTSLPYRAADLRRNR